MKTKKRKNTPDAIRLLHPFMYHLGRNGWYGVVRHPAGALGCFPITDVNLLNALYLHRLGGGPDGDCVNDYGSDPVIDDLVNSAEERQSEMLLGGAR